MRMKAKRVFTAVIAVLLALTFTLGAAANAIGDVDNNGSVTAADARLALRLAVKLEKFAKGSPEFEACDVDFSGTVTAADARMILRAAVKLETLKEKQQDTPSGECTHKWSAWKSNGTNSGTHTRKCSLCAKTETGKCTYSSEKLPQNPKNPGPATCTKDFTWYQRCTVCSGARVGTDYKLNHKNKVLNAAKSLAPTCIDAGYNWYSCPDCGLNGDTLAALKVAVAPLGHSVTGTSITVDSDIICSRCHKRIMPSFNSLVNNINDTTVNNFSRLAKEESTAVVDEKNTKIEIPAAAKWLMNSMAEDSEKFDEETVINMLKEELTKEEPTYSDLLWKGRVFFREYPLPFDTMVSKLTAADIRSITVNTMDAVDFLSEIPDSVNLVLSSGYVMVYDTTAFKELGNVKGTVNKITVELISENYNDIKDSTAETALMRGTGLDIREIPESISASEADASGFNLALTCKGLVSNASISYYFLVQESGGETTYKPLGSKYVTILDIDENVNMDISMPISELGLDSLLLNGLLTLFGLKDGDNLTFMKGNINLSVKQTETKYYLFSDIPA